MSARTFVRVLLITGALLLGLVNVFADSPKATNSSSIKFSKSGGLCDEGFSLQISSEVKGEIRYTIDWTEPTKDSGTVYSKPIPITDTTIVRAALFRDGTNSSPVVTHSFLFLDQIIHQPKDPPGFPAGRAWNGLPADYEMDPQVVNAPEYSGKMKEALRALPTVSIVLPQEDLFGRAKGLYLHTAQRGDEWERPCAVEMILPDGKTAFRVDCGVRIQGNMNRYPQRSPKHSFRLLFRDKYGLAKLHYPLFPDTSVKKFDTLVLRADYNKSWIHWDPEARPRAQRTRDAWMKDTHRAMGWVAPHNRYVHLYLNGLYWGIYDFAERPDADFAAAYFGGAKEDYDVINDFQVKDGKKEGFEQLMASHNLADPAQYERLKSLLNITNYIDYLLLNYYCANQDWGENKNWYVIRRNSPGSLFHYIVWDGEQILHDLEENTITNPYETPFRLATELESNAEYKLAFADRVQKHCFGTGALTPKASTVRWMKWAQEVDGAIIAESARWGDYRRKPGFTRKDWLAEQNRLLNDYFPKRTEILLRQLRDVGLYPKIGAPEVVGSASEFTFRPGTGKIYFTIDQTDPREYGTGKIASHATEFSKPVSIASSTVIKARTLRGKTWSALTEVKL